MRLGRMAKHWEPVQKVMKLLGMTVRTVGPITILLALVMYIFAALGMQLFGATIGPTGEERVSFANFPVALLQVLLVLCNEEWGDVYDAVVEQHPVIGPLYFLFLILMGQFCLLNLVLAGVVEGLRNEQATQHAALRAHVLQLHGAAAG